MLKINIFYLAFGAFLGFAYIYVMNSKPKVVIKYPTMDNLKNTTFVDKNNYCYRYYSKEL